MTRFDEVTRLKELQAAAKPGPWLVYNDPAIRCPTCKTEADGRYMMALTDTPWLLEVAACFHPGDAHALDVMSAFFSIPHEGMSSVDYQKWLQWSLILVRLQKAAEIMEERE